MLELKSISFLTEIYLRIWPESLIYSQMPVISFILVLELSTYTITLLIGIKGIFFFVNEIYENFIRFEHSKQILLHDFLQVETRIRLMNGEWCLIKSLHRLKLLKTFKWRVYLTPILIKEGWVWLSPKRSPTKYHLHYWRCLQFYWRWKGRR